MGVLMVAEFRSEVRFWIGLVLISASLILFAESVYLIKSFAILYGVGVGANVQSVYSGSQVVQSIQRISISAASFPIAIEIAYVLSIISLIAVISAAAIMIKRTERSGMRTYGLVNTVSAVVYLALLMVLLSEFYTYIDSPYIYILYFGLALSLVSGIYLQYQVNVKKAVVQKRSVAIDPAEPFSSMIALQDEVFSKLTGDVMIVDKHFNSVALTNLHRLINDRFEGITSITVITSSGMLDSDLSKNASEFGEELDRKQVGFSIRLMADADSKEQHERFMIDDSSAYKIPPFNIINRKSEHVTRIRRSDVKARFDHLYSNSMTIENYRALCRKCV